MANILAIASLVLGVIALILVFASWMLSRKEIPTNSDLKNAKNLQLAAIVFIFLALLAGLAGSRYPTFGQGYTFRSPVVTVPSVTLPSASVRV